MDTHDNHASPDRAAPLGPVAGETLKDAANWPGHTMVALGLIAFALSLCGFAVGESGLALMALAFAVVAMIAGVSWLYVEHRKLRRRASDLPAERPEDVPPA
ncbi:LapA family protein [Mycolicibacterium sp. 3033]|nr:LapA family protein [Mycolicibacterium aurantiacum]